MKKRLLGILVLCAMLVAFALCACSSGESSSEAPVDEATEAAVEMPTALAELPSFSTMSEVFALEPDSFSYSYTEKELAYAYELDGAQVRVTADMTKDVYDACDAVSFEDEDHDAKVRELLGVLPVKSVEDLSLSIIPQEELDAFVGKTGQDLLDVGFIEGDFYQTGDAPVFNLANGNHQYAVAFNEAVPEGADIVDVAETIAPLTVKSITYAGLSDAASDAEAPAE